MQALRSSVCAFALDLPLLASRACAVVLLVAFGMQGMSIGGMQGMSIQDAVHAVGHLRFKLW
jgi:hypothetical protein